MVDSRWCCVTILLMRCFIAIDLPDNVLRKVIQLKERLSTRVSTVRWTRAEQIHLTLKFLGEVPDPDVPVVCEYAQEVASQFNPIDLQVASVGCFPPRGGVRIVWVGMSDPSGELLRCYKALEDAFGDLGFNRESRPFHAHLTIGRVNNPRESEEIRRILKSNEGFDAGSYTAEELVVYESILKKTGPIYAPMARARFA